MKKERQIRQANDKREFRVDETIAGLVKWINFNTPFRTLASCSGHGKYPPTIVIERKNSHETPWEIFSNQPINRTRNFYKMDQQGIFFIPETTEKPAINEYVEKMSFNSGEVISIHVGEFFGVHDLRVRTKSKARLILIFDEKPEDLIIEK